MQKFSLNFLVLSVLLSAVIFSVSSWISPGAVIIPLRQETPAITPVVTPIPTQHSWIIIDLPPDATQMEYGAEVYRLVCKACHGDRGQGLTNDWRAQWNPKDQNCWQSKCHALNHPPDGFYIPMVPAVVGTRTLQRFKTALDMYNYIQTTMPWHDPGSLIEKDAWSATAYILKINGIVPESDLNHETAAKLDLGLAVSASYAPSPPPLPTATPSPPPLPTAVGKQSAEALAPQQIFTFILLALAIAVVVLIAARFYKRSA